MCLFLIIYAWKGDICTSDIYTIDEDEINELIECLDDDAEDEDEKSRALYEYKEKYKLTNVKVATVLGISKKKVDRLLDGYADVSFLKEIRKSWELYWEAVPKFIAELRERKEKGQLDAKEFYEIKRDLYNINRAYTFDYDKYTCNQVGFYEAITDEEGNQIQIGDSNSYMAEINSLVKELLDSLDDRERKVIILHYFYELDYRTIADKIGVSKSTVGNLHSSAMAKMREKKIDKDILNCFDGPTIHHNCGSLGISHYYTNECPCKLMAYLHKSFGNKKTVCPGSYTEDGKRLLCAKKVTCRVEGRSFNTRMTIEEAVAFTRYSKDKVSVFRNTRRLPVTNDAYDKRKINGKLIRDCGQEVYFCEDTRIDKKYRLNYSILLPLRRFDFDYRKTRKHLDCLDKKAKILI